MKTPGRSNIGNVESEVRDLINDTVGYKKFPRNTWMKICAAMDSVGDTSLILDITQLRRVRGGYAAKYLRLYGLLQAVHAQQDSIEFLWSEIIGDWKKPAKDSAWLELRIWRNILVAHTAKSGGAIGRITMGRRAVVVSRLDEKTQEPQMMRLRFESLLDRYVVEARHCLIALASEIRNRY